MVTPSGTITTAAGTGATGIGGTSGPATAAILDSPYAVALDGAGNLFIADSTNNVIRRVAASTGAISPFAGTGNCCYGGNGTGGDGGVATSATLYFPASVAVDRSGSVYFTSLVRRRLRNGRDLPEKGVELGVSTKRIAALRHKDFCANFS